MASFIGVGLAKCEAPPAHRFIRYHNSALCQKFFDIAKTEREAERQPCRIADYFWWEAKALVVRSSDICFHKVLAAHCSALYQVDNTLSLPFLVRPPQAVNSSSFASAETVMGDHTYQFPSLPQASNLLQLSLSL
jgi:hypothetical protein